MILSSYSWQTGAPARNLPANSIGFMRLLLAAMVIYTHAYYLGGYEEEPLMRWSHGALSAGTVAVQCFFVLSGWLVASSWLRLQSLPVFLWHRFLRLGPGYWVCLMVTAAAIGPLLHQTSVPRPGPYLALEPGALDYVWRNLVQPRAQISIGNLTLANPHPGDLNGSLWTLFYEGACYLVVAACGLAALLGRRARCAWAGLPVLLLLVHPLARGGMLPGFVLKLFDTPGKLMCWHFAAGMACAVVPEIACYLAQKSWPAVVGLVGLSLAWRLGCGEIVSPLALPPVLFRLGEILPARGWERRVGGDYSYGLYVYGYPVQQLLAHWGLHRHGLAIYLLLSLLAAGMLAWLSWQAVESPALQLRDIFRRRPQPIPVS